MPARPRGERQPTVSTVCARRRHRGLRVAHAAMETQQRQQGLRTLTVNRVRVNGDLLHAGAASHVPHHDHVVEAGREQDVLRGWVPLHNANATLVTLELDDGRADVLRHAALRDLPDHHVAVLAARRNNMVVVRAELQVEDGGCVAANLGRVQVDAASLRAQAGFMCGADSESKGEGEATVREWMGVRPRQGPRVGRMPAVHHGRADPRFHRGEPQSGMCGSQRRPGTAVPRRRTKGGGGRDARFQCSRRGRRHHPAPREQRQQTWS